MHVPRARASPSRVTRCPSHSIRVHMTPWRSSWLCQRCHGRGATRSAERHDGQAPRSAAPLATLSELCVARPAAAVVWPRAAVCMRAGDERSSPRAIMLAWLYSVVCAIPALLSRLVYASAACVFVCVRYRCRQAWDGRAAVSRAGRAPRRVRGVEIAAGVREEDARALSPPKAPSILGPAVYVSYKKRNLSLLNIS